MTLTLIALMVLAFSLAVLATWLVYLYALHQQRLDIPNARSSHNRPTPRGGGLAIAIVFSLGLIVLVSVEQLTIALFVTLIGGGWLLVLIGWWEDRQPLPRWLRFISHIIAAAWALFWLPVEPLLVAGLTLFGLVWLINLYNFMDGIDGIAASEAICVASASMVLLGWDNELSYVFSLLGICCAGFLVLNWSPAKIFMGDTGSYFLGFTLGVLALAASAQSGLPMTCWVLLLGVFFVDATVTLVRRMLAGARWYEAHRSHAYQHAARYWDSHARVTTVVIGINLVWLFPWAYIGAIWQQWIGVLFVVALGPLLWLALTLDAGHDEK